MYLKVLMRCTAVAIVNSGLLLCSQAGNAQTTYTLKATPKTVAGGYYDAKAALVLRVKSGDAVC